jgi:tetratricopeptide (TPR) repeat protein
MRRTLVLMALAASVILAGGGTAAATIPPAPNAVEAARAADLAGNADSAIARLVPYVASHPEDTAAARLLGGLYVRVGDLGRAEAAWKAETRRHPDDRETHERLGTLYASNGRVADALDEFDKSLPLRGGLIQLIALQQRTKGIDAFTNEAQLGARLNPDDPWHLTLYATVLEAMHRPVEALQYYTRVVELTPMAERCEERVTRAVDYFDLKRDAEGINDLQACLHGNPNDYAALTIYGWSYLRSADFAHARPLLEHALAVNPNGVEALIDMGYLDDATGDAAAATQCYRRAIAGDPLRPEAYVDLGFDYAAKRNFAQAEATYNAGLLVAPGNGRLHYLLGETYRSQGKVGPARAQFESALTSDESEVVNAARAALSALPAQAGYVTTEPLSPLFR